MIKAYVRDHKEHEFIYLYCKNTEELRVELEKGFKYYSLISYEEMEELLDDEQ